jgi:hypothetical protein
VGHHQVLCADSRPSRNPDAILPVLKKIRLLHCNALQGLEETGDGVNLRFREAGEADHKVSLALDHCP